MSLSRKIAEQIIQRELAEMYAKGRRSALEDAAKRIEDAGWVVKEDGLAVLQRVITILRGMADEGAD